MNQSRPYKKKPHARSTRKPRKDAYSALIATRPDIDLAARVSLDDGSYVIFDIETTGGNPERNGITDIFAIKWQNGKIVDTFGTLVDPKIPIPPIVRKMTGITNAMVRGAPLIGEVMPHFVKFVGHSILVSHNTIGDMKFIRYFAEQSMGHSFDNYFLCTHLLVEKLFPETPDKSLSGLAQYFKIPSGNLHRAEADAYATLGLFKELLKKLKQKNFESIDETIRFQGDMESGLRLGWAVPKETLSKLPQSPGVFTLFDSEKRPMLVCSAFNLQRDIQRLCGATQLPRQILKMVLRTYHIATEPTSSLFQAMIKEAESSTERNSGILLHQRQITAFVISKDKKHYKVAVEPIGPAALFAYGPIRDRKVAQEIMSQLAAALGKTGKSLTKDGFACDSQELSLIKAFLTRTLTEFKSQTDKKIRALSLLFQPSKRRTLKNLISHISSLESIQLPAKTIDLLGFKGILAVRKSIKSDPSWEFYHIDRSFPVEVTDPNLTSFSPLSPTQDIEDLLKDVAVKMSSLKTHRGRKKTTPEPLDAQRARVIGATIWWLVNLRGDSRFLPFAEKNQQAIIGSP